MQNFFIGKFSNIFLWKILIDATRDLIKLYPTVANLKNLSIQDYLTENPVFNANHIEELLAIGFIVTLPDFTEDYRLKH